MRLLAVTALAALAVNSAAALEIEKIEAKVFLTSSATFSDNVAMGSGVNLWNTVIGEGDIPEPARDALVIVTVSGEPGTFDTGTLEVGITGAEGELVASRTIEGLLLGANGKVSQGIYITDITCNAITVKASVGKSAKTTTVPFACGE